MAKKLSANQLAVLAMACTHGHLTQGCRVQSDYGGRASTLLSLRRAGLLDAMNKPTDAGKQAHQSHHNQQHLDVRAQIEGRDHDD